MDKNGLIMYFQYDSKGNLISMTFEGTRYYFVKNQQGDVEKIVNKQGIVVVTYKYDAWGNLCGITDTSGAWDIGKMNPFRYRSYIYYDETGLYYLQSRYYDLVTGRFLNADDISCIGSTGTALSSNVFVYCEDNAINYTDHNGFKAKKVNKDSPRSSFKGSTKKGFSITSKIYINKICYRLYYTINKKGVLLFDFNRNPDYATIFHIERSRSAAEAIYKAVKNK